MDAKFDIQTGVEHQLSRAVTFLKSSSFFQINNKLYMCGGEKNE